MLTPCALHHPCFALHCSCCALHYSCAATTSCSPKEASQAPVRRCSSRICVFSLLVQYLWLVHFLRHSWLVDLSLVHLNSSLQCKRLNHGAVVVRQSHQTQISYTASGGQLSDGNDPAHLHHRLLQANPCHHRRKSLTIAASNLYRSLHPEHQKLRPVDCEVRGTAVVAA